VVKVFENYNYASRLKVAGVEDSYWRTLVVLEWRS